MKNILAALLFLLPYTASADTSGRELLTTDRTYYVSTSGADTNSCLASDAFTACRTLQHVANLIAGTIDTGNSTVTVQIASGSYAGVQMLRPFTGSGWVVFSGDTTTPSNVVITAVTGGAGFQATFQAGYRVQGFKIADSSISAGLYASAGGLIETIGPMEFGAICTGAWCAHVNASVGGHIVLASNYSISGSSWTHLTADVGGTLETTLSSVILTGTPNFSGAFALAYRGGTMRTPGITFTGSATGQRRVAMMNGVIDTMTGNANYFPGDSAGLVSSGGVYD